MQEWVTTKLRIPLALRPMSGGSDSDKRSNKLDSSELQAILMQQQAEGVCLLTHSPFRILRVSTPHLYTATEMK